MRAVFLGTRSTAKWGFFHAATFFLQLILGTGNRIHYNSVTKSSSKVEQTGALYCRLHTFIHWCHTGAGLKKFIHLHHGSSVQAPQCIRAKIKCARLFYLGIDDFDSVTIPSQSHLYQGRMSGRSKISPFSFIYVIFLQGILKQEYVVY